MNIPSPTPDFDTYRPTGPVIWWLTIAICALFAAGAPGIPVSLAAALLSIAGTAALKVAADLAGGIAHHTAEKARAATQARRAKTAEKKARAEQLSSRRP
jgi:hypothetical protein